jgi:hypothetical protein
MNLAEDLGTPTLRTMLPDLERNHEVYYLTTRLGQRPKRQTEIWLIEHLRYLASPPLRNVYPTVGVAAYRQKGYLVRGLGLEVFVDDNLDNVNDIASATTPEHPPLKEGDLIPPPTCRIYLLNRAYNKNAGELNPYIVRVDSLGEMFDKEIALGHL